MKVFLHGPMRHRPLLEAVLGTPPPSPGREAKLSGLSIEQAPGPDLPPAPVRRPEAVAEGEVVELDSEEALARLGWYEGLFGNRRESATLVDGEEVATWLPADAPESTGAAWSFNAWRERMGATATLAATEALRRREKEPAGEVASLMSFITARAWARVLARTPAPQTLRSPAGSGNVRLLRDRAAFDGFFRLEAFDIEHECFDGSMSGPVSRETFISYDVAMVLPYDPHRDCVLIIEQLRYGPVHRGDPVHRLLEPVAGLVDAGEEPIDCARREAVEEAHLRIEDISPMMETYSSPGYSTEFMHCFLGICDLDGADGALGGHPDENEDIRTHVIPFDRAMELLDSGEINVAPLAMMLLWLSRHRDRLRAAA